MIMETNSGQSTAPGFEQAGGQDLSYGVLNVFGGGSPEESLTAKMKAATDADPSGGGNYKNKNKDPLRSNKLVLSGNNNPLPYVHVHQDFKGSLLRRTWCTCPGFLKKTIRNWWLLV
jgi:hypothetical protein